MAGHLMEATQRIVDGDRQRRDEAIAKAGAEVLDDLTMPEDDLEQEQAAGGLPEGAEALEDVEAPVVVLPEIGTPVRYHARRGHMRRRQTEFPATVLGHREDGTVDLYVVFDSGDSIVEEHVNAWTEEEPFHCFALLGNSQQAQREEISNLWAEFNLLRSQVLGDYIDPPRSVMDYLVEFEGKLAAMTSAGNKPKKAAKKD